MKHTKERKLSRLFFFGMGTGLALLVRSSTTTIANVPIATTTKMITTGTFGRINALAFNMNGRTRSRRISPLDGPSLKSSVSTSTKPRTSPLDENFFLNQVEATISNVLGQHGGSPESTKILDLPVAQREEFGVARHLYKRLGSLRRNNDCPRCWMQRKHCICRDCYPVIGYDGKSEGSRKVDSYDGTQMPDSIPGGLNRIFLVVHHKEIGLKVDTAKLILASFPFQCKLVIGGIGPEHQASMHEMLDSIQDPKRMSLLLFPDETAKTLQEIVKERRETRSMKSLSPDQYSKTQNANVDDKYDLIVLDGTWAQARKFHSRYFPMNSPSSFQRIQLSEASVEMLQEGSTEKGHQLRRHQIPWRQVGTFEAFRLFLRDWEREFPSREDDGSLELWEQIESYQRIANYAAIKELGQPRL